MIFFVILRSFSKECMKYIGKKNCFHKENARMLLASLMLILLVSCGNKAANISYEPESSDANQFHADNDIAMTVCSLVDALRVGERLDSTDYNFDGILTDGQGTPLYTDVEGNPGEWKVRVENSEEARISNLYLGDLMTEDLRNYILGALGLNNADLATAYVNPSDEHEFIWLFDAGDVNVAFSETLAKYPNGLEGTLMAVSVSKK